jgi:hypothetical protein
MSITAAKSDLAPNHDRRRWLGFASAGHTQPQTIYNADGLRITAAPGHHRDAPAVVYRIAYGGKSITFSGDVDAAGLERSSGRVDSPRLCR